MEPFSFRQKFDWPKTIFRDCPTLMMSSPPIHNTIFVSKHFSISTRQCHPSIINFLAIIYVCFGHLSAQ